MFERQLISSSDRRVPVASTDLRECRFIARQPIFDRHEHVFGYELLFRSGAQGCFPSIDPDAASRSTIDMSLLIGPRSLTEGRRAFVNFTRELLIDGTATVLPRDLGIIEILEDIEPDAAVLNACRDLKRLGYTLALDDLVDSRTRAAFVPFVDIVKVDFTLTTPATQHELASTYKRRGIRLLAEKVEAREEFDSALRMGYEYFQGYFFCRPTTITAHDIPSLHLTYLGILKAAMETNFDINAVEQAIKQEPGLCFRLLRYLNSAAFGIYPVRSIRHALTLIGQRELQKWITIAAAMALAGPRSSELISAALTRARFCELVATVLRTDSSDFFLVGMFSLIDAIIDQPLGRVLSELPLSTPAKSALLGRAGPLLTVLSLAVACERADWDSLAQLSSALAIDSVRVATIHAESMEWVRNIVSEHVPEQAV